MAWLAIVRLDGPPGVLEGVDELTLSLHRFSIDIDAFGRRPTDALVAKQRPWLLTYGRRGALEGEVPFLGQLTEPNGNRRWQVPLLSGRPTREELDRLADQIARIILGHVGAKGSPSQLLEQLVRTCRRLVLDNEELRDWVDYWFKRSAELESVNSDLRHQILEVNLRLEQFERQVQSLEAELRLPSGVSHTSTGIVRSTGRLASLLDNTIAAMLGGLSVLGVQHFTAPSPPAPRLDLTVEIGAIDTYCQAMVEQLPLTE